MSGLLPPNNYEIHDSQHLPQRDERVSIGMDQLLVIAFKIWFEVQTQPHSHKWQLAPPTLLPATSTLPTVAGAGTTLALVLRGLKAYQGLDLCF